MTSRVALLSLVVPLALGAGRARADAPQDPPRPPAQDAPQAPAQNPPQAQPAGAPQSPPQPAPQPDDEKSENWIDFGHAFIGEHVFAPVYRVDRFFSDERDLEAERARSFLRWRNEFRFPANSLRPTYTTSVSANLKFPGLNKQLNRIHLEVLGQTRDTFGTLFPRQNAGPGDVPGPEDTVGKADAGLALRLWDTLESHADVGAGVSVALPPGAYTRLRFRFAQALGYGVVSRQALIGFWRTETRFGSTLSADLERPLARSMVTRLTGSTTLSEVSRGFEWFGDLSVAATFFSRVGAAVGTSIAGATRGIVPVDSYRVYTRVRRDVYRRWIFLELEPEYAWPWSPDLGRHGTWAVSLRAEVQFQGNERLPGAGSRTAPAAGPHPVPQAAGAPPKATPAGPAPAPAPAPSPRPATPASAPSAEPLPAAPAPASDPEPRDPEPADSPAIPTGPAPGAPDPETASTSTEAGLDLRPAGRSLALPAPPRAR